MVLVWEVYILNNKNKPITTITKEDLINALSKSGIVGLGGAGFPTAVKFKTDKPIEYLIINSAECEPYITSDNYTMLKKADMMEYAIETLVKFFGIENVIIGIEKNKPKAIAKMSELSSKFDNVSVKMAKNQNLSLNPVKISGNCGKLLCCINYENEVKKMFTEILANGYIIKENRARLRNIDKLDFSSESFVIFVERSNILSTIVNKNKIYYEYGSDCIFVYKDRHKKIYRFILDRRIIEDPLSNSPMLFEKIKNKQFANI